MKKFLNDWIFPIISLVMFATLLGAMLSQMNTMSLSALVSYSAGLLAYSMMLTVTFIGSRPRFIEKHVGMPRMYEVHSMMSVVLFIMILIHIVLQWGGFNSLLRSPATQAGYLGFGALIFVMFTGIFSLSGIFVSKNKTLRNWKEKVFNREVSLWLHRLAIVSDVAVFIHLAVLPFLRNNTAFMILLSLYTVLVLGYYAIWKIQIAQGVKYAVKQIYKATPSLWVLEFEPQNGKLPAYNPGDYFFIRFKGADITGEGHPFSTSSAITKEYSNIIQFMIKEAGDWTGALDNIKVGDIAQLEGPYGDFYTEDSKNSDRPFVLMGGGIGLTPNLSILRSEIERESQRDIHLVWALSWEEDMFMLDELDEYKKVNPNFQYHIIFSNEEVEGYPFGFISHPFLEDVGVANIYKEADFFICGPDIMMSSTKNVLLNNGVPEDSIHVDEFGF